MARICLNACSVYPGMTGIGQYACSLVAALRSTSGGHEYVVLRSPGHDALGDGFPANWCLVDIKGAEPMWEQLQLPGLLDECEADLYHTALLTTPIVRVCKSIITLHDVIPLAHPDLVPSSFRDLFHRWIGPSLRACDRVVTTSNAAKAEIVAHLDVEAERVAVVHQCVGHRFRPRRPDELTSVLSRHGLEAGRYLLYVGAIDRRKNVERLLKAYAESKALREFGVRLAVCGRSADGEYTLEVALSSAGARLGICELGYVPDEDLAPIVAGARALVFPSLAEGFGRPVLEALASGVPVVASGIAPLREVAGDAAEWVDAQDVESIAEGIRAVLSEDDDVRATRRERGLARAKEFGPERFASETLAVYAQLLGG